MASGAITQNEIKNRNTGCSIQFFWPLVVGAREAIAQWRMDLSDLTATANGPGALYSGALF
jgi:hypothetical protein